MARGPCRLLGGCARVVSDLFYVFQAQRRGRDAQSCFVRCIPFRNLIHAPREFQTEREKWRQALKTRQKTNGLRELLRRACKL